MKLAYHIAVGIVVVAIGLFALGCVAGASLTLVSGGTFVDFIFAISVAGVVMVCGWLVYSVA
jgi:hypothetical protein